ncbi:uncharacterized protein LOC142321584 [Lycorma delicatula]|uniref:uncharacterized protein LOC142321584 n=1 Tax=Lycorma delicatula TaxID=130591 RepID=UPI003F510EDD
MQSNGNIIEMKLSGNSGTENFIDNNVILSSTPVATRANHCVSLESNVVQRVTGKDDERDLLELMIASSTIPSTVSSNSGSTVKSRNDRTSGSTGGATKNEAKKKAKQQRDLTRDLTLLLPDSFAVQEEKAFSFAQAYYLKVRDRLEENAFLQFVNALNSFDNQCVTVSDLYHNIMTILKPHSDLSEEFIGFLLPEQAMELGVYMEYLCITKMRQFLQKLEIYFSKQPQQIRKIYECLTKLANESASKHIDQSTVRNVMLPLLKSSSLLTEYFLQLFPYEQPPLFECSDTKDFEKVDCGEFDECGSGIQHAQDVDSWDWETVEIPDLEDPFGGDNCPCNCHTNKISSVSGHCFSCGIKFINGRVFIQNGKVLRHAKLVVEGINKKDLMERICKKTSVKDVDDKGVGTLRHRKRPAADSSPVKNNCNSSTQDIGSSGNFSLLSPIGIESEDDASDIKSLPTKAKSPRTIKPLKIIKGNSNQVETNKDKDVEGNKEKVTHMEYETLNLDSFVVLNYVKNADNFEVKSTNSIKDNSCDDFITNSKSSQEREDEEEVEREIEKSLKNVNNDTIIPLLSSASSLSPKAVCHEAGLIHDDDEDDVEDVDIYDDDDDVDDDEEDDDEGEDIEEDEEEDDEDIEEVEIDEDEEREMDVEFINENEDDDDDVEDKLYEKGHSTNNKQPESEQIKNSDCEISKFESMNKVIIKTEFDNSSNEVTLIQDNIKLEVAKIEDDYNNENACGILSSFDNKVNESEFLSTDIQQQQQSLPTDVLTSDVESVGGAPSSWTKEEDKVILQTFQQEGDSDQTFIMIRERLPLRSVEEVKSRFHILMLLLKRMTTSKNSSESY